MRNVFVIMPINENTEGVYSMIKNVCDLLGFKCIRADNINVSGVIVDQIINNIIDADIILADLTPKDGNIYNPNVFYEVGYSDALGKPPVLLVEKEKLDQLGQIEFPFDIKHKRIFSYEKSKPDKFKDKLKNRLEVEAEKLSNNNDYLGIWNAVYGHKHSLSVNSPISVSNRLLMLLYVSGLAAVKKKFWCTTYLTSGFWARDNEIVYGANKDMLRNLSNLDAHNSPNCVERIFLLKTSKADFLNEIGNEIIESRKKGGDEFKRIKGRYDRLKSICSELRGCEIKYFDKNLFDFPKPPFVPFDTEIAIYDDFRVDYFDGGSDGKISSVNIYTLGDPEFRWRKLELEGYFKQLSMDSVPIDDLFKDIDNVYKYYSEKIDYSLQRLVEYENGIYDIDESLKNFEMQVVVQNLEKNFLSSVNSYMDIGTCTGRYPYYFASIFNSACDIVGVDADIDCINYVQSHRRIRDKKINSNCTINFIQSDFLRYDKHISNRTYDLMTCMMGTISHFGWNKKENFEDDLQSSLEKMHELLSDNGILVFGNWSARGLKSRMLEIYDDNDRFKIRQYTESTSIMKIRLRRSSFDIIGIYPTQDERINVFICKKLHND